jgi:hypothetical protein
MMAAVQNNFIDYSGLTLYASPNVGGTALQELSLSIIGASYVYTSNTGTTYSYIINTSTGVPTDFLYLRNTDNLGSTLGDRLITTDSSGNGDLSFNVVKGSNTNFMLYYSPSVITYENNDHTRDLPLGVTLSPQPDGLLSVNNQVIQPQSITSSIINLSGIKYDGFNVPDGSTAGIVVYQQNQGEVIAAYNRGLTYSAGSKVINSTQYQTTIPGTTANIVDNNFYFYASSNLSNSAYPIDITGVTSNWLLAKTFDATTRLNAIADVPPNLLANISYNPGDIVLNGSDVNYTINTSDSGYYVSITDQTTNPPIGPLPLSVPNTTDWIYVGNADPQLIPSVYDYDAGTTYGLGDQVTAQVGPDSVYFIYHSTTPRAGIDPIANITGTITIGSYGTHWVCFAPTGNQSPILGINDGINMNPVDIGYSFSNSQVLTTTNAWISGTSVGDNDGFLYGCISQYNSDGSNAFPGSSWILLYATNPSGDLDYLSGLTSGSFLNNNTYNLGDVVLNDQEYVGLSILEDVNTVDGSAYYVPNGITVLPNDYPIDSNGDQSYNWEFYGSIGYTALSGITSGDMSIIQGTTLGSITSFSNNNAFNTISGYTLTWDSKLDDLYMIYYQGLSGFTGPSYNFLSVSPFNLPLNNSPTIFRSDSNGVTANIYNINYNFGGVTSGQILVTDQQAGTTSIRNILKNPNFDFYYAPYFFNSIGGTAIVEPGSYYQYVNPLDSNLLSGATFSIPAHLQLVEDQGITGQLAVSQYDRRQKIVLDLSQFDYFDKDQNSIFNSFDIIGHTGQIYLVSQNSGNTGTLYSGLTGIPFSGSTASITYAGPSYIVEFPDLGPTGPTTIPYNLSFYDNTEQLLRTSNITIPVQFSGLVPTNEILNAVEEEKVLSSSNLYLKFDQFDYLDEYTSSIFGPGGITGGTLSLVNGTTLGTLLGSTAYDYSLGSTYNYIISATGTFSSTQLKQTYLRFAPNGTTSYNRAYKSIVFNPNETFISNFVNYNETPTSLRFTLTSFDYLDSSGLSVFNSSWYASNPHIGSIELCNPSGIVLQSLSFTGNPTTQSFQFSINAQGPFNTYFLRFNDSTINFTRSSIKYTIKMSTGITSYPDGNADRGVAFGYTGPAALQFPYVFNANAAESTEIIVLGELTKPLDYDQKIVLNVPSSELQRMLVYDSAWWGGQYGTGASGGGGFSGFSGTTHQTASGFTGPNVGLFLKYVLSQVNVEFPEGFTGHNGVSGQSDRLGGLDILFSGPTSVNYQTLGNSGQTGNPWGVTGGSTGYFLDDAGISGPAIIQYMADNNITGIGATFSPNSLLNFIPVEAIRSITQLGFRIDKVADVVTDIDTTLPTYVDPLRNLFEQSVAYSRVTDSVEYLPSIVPSSLRVRFAPDGTTLATPWTSVAKVYGVDFVDGDSLTFYIRYAMGAVRRYGIDPSVVAGLDPIWQNAPSIKLTFNGKSFDIPIGSSSPYSGLTGGGTTGGSDRDTELSIGGQLRTVAIQLLASPNKSNFDY